MASAIDVIKRHGRKLAVQTPKAKTITDGYAIDNGSTQRYVIGTIQPLSPKELRNMPEGQNAADWRNVWSVSELLLRDRVQIDSQWYTVQRVEFWDEGKFWKAQVTRAIDKL